MKTSIKTKIISIQIIVLNMTSNPIINLNLNFPNSNLITSISNINCIKTHNCNVQNLKLSNYET
jgi:hypothetical protein